MARPRRSALSRTDRRRSYRYVEDESEPFAAELTKFQLVTFQWAEWIDKNVDELWARQYGKPAVGHKGLNFKPESSSNNQ